MEPKDWPLAIKVFLAMLMLGAIILLIVVSLIIPFG